MQKPLKDPHTKPKYIYIVILVSLLAGSAIWWFSSDDADPPQITEHTFDIGTASWMISEYPAKVLHANLFTVDIKDLQGLPIKDAVIRVKLEMLSMVCGDYDFEMIESSPGNYEGEGVPLMAGTWSATLTLETNQQSYTISRLLKAVH
ncbi:hypothetical protein [Paenibacillus sinopodophylli]|uniref:hypothetical protein n=1 Tax=Paenibacillus sinopodophylli TaxID=1837342 RepID=UPI00110CE724|nr:hypothetical protein [Paenibacillus sinopodophylli]